MFKTTQSKFLSLKAPQSALAVLLCASALATAPASWAKTLHFHVSGGSPNAVEFTSDAPVEVIHGKTSQITGDISLDDSFKFDAKHPFSIVLSVDLASIDTGIDLRNEHMRDNFLETAKYPKAVFKATSIQLKGKPDLSKPQTVKLVSTGEFSLHGVTVKKTVPLTVDYKPAEAGKPARIRVHGKLSVPLVQHNIKRPEAVLVKLAETVFVDITAIGVEQ